MNIDWALPITIGAIAAADPRHVTIDVPLGNLVCHAHEKTALLTLCIAEPEIALLFPAKKNGCIAIGTRCHQSTPLLLYLPEEFRYAGGILKRKIRAIFHIAILDQHESLRQTLVPQPVPLG